MLPRFFGVLVGIQLWPRPEEERKKERERRFISENGSPDFSKIFFNTAIYHVFLYLLIFNPLFLFLKFHSWKFIFRINFIEIRFRNSSSSRPQICNDLSFPPPLPLPLWLSPLVCAKSTYVYLLNIMQRVIFQRNCASHCNFSCRSPAACDDITVKNG